MDIPVLGPVSKWPREGHSPRRIGPHLVMTDEEIATISRMQGRMPAEYIEARMLAEKINEEAGLYD